MTACLDPAVSLFSADDLSRHLAEFGELLHACVLAGASVNFVLPFSRQDAEAFWVGKVLPGVTAGTRHLFVIRQGERIAGTVQLDCDTPPNQPHRADVSKLLVHPDFRRQGLARDLMTALERHALALGRSLLTLDTRTGDSAEPLYASLGYVTVGTIPGYCRDPFEGRLEATTIMYRQL
ncbi:GNAT family N-acetyltransferase [Stappia sp. F7233]|uniref:GNAT family N-acetyltransferase n=1 Tax=Stappia albiluteola TaxID=2758565 RepID=A0A839AF86_9HYPH|nr:GNAT family N-acetyltransferase [Stappia albiluteola]MBA5777766.1 GNAT family N-acetyltransferase [Stappia albiluteola]